jgi:hypothetical protein
MADIPTAAWDETYPSGTTKINLGDDSQRTIKTSVREVIAVDHEFASSGQTSTTGQHKQVTLQEQADLGTGAVGATILGSQTVSGKGELIYTDEDDNDVQITSAGEINTAALKAGALPTDITIVSTNIIDDTIVNADINSSAAIAATKIANGSISNTEFQYLNGVTSAIQTQINNLIASGYDSGWFSINTTTTNNVSKTHSLGTSLPKIDAFIGKVETGGKTYYVDLQTNFYGDSGQYVGARLCFKDSNTLAVSVGTTSIVKGYCVATDGTRTNLDENSISVRILLSKGASF